MGRDLEEVDVSLLRERRGEQRVSFNHVADHLVDFAERFPQSRAVVERLAVFLAGVEQADHDHPAPGAAELRGGTLREHRARS